MPGGPLGFMRLIRVGILHGMIELNKMFAMEAKLDAFMHRLDKRMHSANEIGAVER